PENRFDSGPRLLLRPHSTPAGPAGQTLPAPNLVNFIIDIGRPLVYYIIDTRRGIDGRPGTARLGHRGDAQDHARAPDHGQAVLGAEFVAGRAEVQGHHRRWEPDLYLPGFRGTQTRLQAHFRLPVRDEARGEPGRIDHGNGNPHRV